MLEEVLTIRTPSLVFKMAIIFAFPLYPELRANNTKVSLTVNVEKWRCIAYIFFWLMCLLAVIMTNLFVIDILAAGPDPSLPLERKGCGPFNRVSLSS